MLPPFPSDPTSWDFAQPVWLMTAYKNKKNMIACGVGFQLKSEKKKKPLQCKSHLKFLLNMSTQCIQWAYGY